MNELLKIALMKGMEKQGKAVDIKPGKYNVDEVVTLRVRGTINRGADYEQAPTCNIPLLATMALFMEKAGFQRELCKTLMVDAMKEAMAGNLEGRETVQARLKDLEVAMEHVREITEELPKKPCKGACKAQITVEAVSA